MIVSGNIFLVVTCLRPLQKIFFLTMLVTLRSLHSFNLKLEQLSHKKVLKFGLLGNYFPDRFIAVKIWFEKTFKFVLGQLLEK